MSARIVRLDEAGVRERLEALLADIAAGRVVAVALVEARADGHLGADWRVGRSLGPHAGTVLRGMVAYLAAVMDAEAVAPTEQPIAFGGGEDTWTP